MSEQRNFQKLDRPFGVRIPFKLHQKYKSLSGFERKTIQYKLVKWLEKQLKKGE